MGHKNQKCVICEENFTEWGNNPEPIKTMEQGTCCKSIQDNKERKLNKLISNKKYLCKDSDALAYRTININ